VVVDTMVAGWLMSDAPPPRASGYEALIGRAGILLSFQTVMELRFGAFDANWSQLRVRRLERRLAAYSLVQPDDLMVTTCAILRAECRRNGHALAGKIHDGDRWIAATAMRLGCSLVSDDRIFLETPGLSLLTLAG
jgi:tRNA(fMet)-specific endonuclease VapC